jgi:hypothetical protein
VLFMPEDEAISLISESAARHPRHRHRARLQPDCA